jgi:mono/diheme cytochrome c family protein
VANYVLGLSTRQLNGSQTYSSTGVTDNQLRTLNRLGLFNPAFDESGVTNFEKLSALGNTGAAVQDRARSYLDANCAQCHQPGGSGIGFDARFDTPLANQNLVNGGLDANGLAMIVPKDIWRSIIHQRMDTTNNVIRMPALARQLIDSNAVAVLEEWINSLPGTPAQAPPTIAPNGGTFTYKANIGLTAPDSNATIYYTLDGSTPTISSLLYSNAFDLTSNAVVTASAFRTGYVKSMSSSAPFFINPVRFTSQTFSNGTFNLQLLVVPGSNYILQASSNMLDWTPIATNPATTNMMLLVDPNSSKYPNRFYRFQQQ